MFTAEQQIFIRSLGFQPDFDNLTDEDFAQIEELIGDALVMQGLDRDYNPTPIGELCESILYQLP